MSENISSSFSSSSEDELSDDTEESIPRHLRQARMFVNKTLMLYDGENSGVPVYCSSVNKISSPPKSVIVNGRDRTVRKVSEKMPTVMPDATKPMFVIPYKRGPIMDMIAIKNASKEEPTAIIFHNVHPKDVWLMFQFYKEIMGAVDDSKVSDALRESTLELKRKDIHALFSLATTVGATILQSAIQSTTDSYPEATMTTRIIEAEDDLKKTIPYIVIPHMNLKTLRFGLPKGPIVVVDVTAGVSTLQSSSIMTPMFKRSRSIPKDAIKTMTLAIFKNLTTLYKESQKPKLVVFANTCPSGVLAMLNYYECMVNPALSLKGPGCKQTIYSLLETLNLLHMSQVKNSWLILATLCGAELFENILRRN